MLAAASLWVLLANAALAAPVERSADLNFSTRGQSLFSDSGTATHTQSLQFDVLKSNEPLLTRGRIVNTKVPLSVSTLQAIWQKAMDTCTGYKYKIVAAGATIATISPSATECMNGEIRRNYCIAPPSLGWSACLDIGSNRQTYVKDLGPGIGPKPTQPTSLPYDFGAIVKMNSDVRVGFKGSYSYDLGSVDVDYAAKATLHFDKDTAQPGDEVTVTTSYTDGTPYVMSSRYPSFELALDMYAYARMSLDAEYAGVNQSNGDQVHTTRTLYSIDTRNNPDAVDGVVPFSNGSERLFGVRLDSTGLTTTILGSQNHVDARYEYELTFPFGSPDKPGKKAPRYKLPVSFSLADFAFTVPRLDTPAPADFNCGICAPARNEIIDGALTNTTPVGARQLLGGITDGNGIVLPLVNDGAEDVDLARVDLDLDVITAAADAPLGVIVSDPAGLLDAELNLLDFDLATFLSADQKLTFTPNLEVELRFSQPTEVRTPGQTDFVEVDSCIVKLGDTVVFKQPATAVTVTPVFTLRDNAFANVTRLMMNNALQETLGQVKLGGAVGDALQSVLGDDPNFALLQITPTLYDPQPVWSTDATPWALDGFVDQSAPAVTINLPSTGSGGSGGGSGAGGSSSGGGGSFDVATLLGLAGLLGMLQWSRRRRAARGPGA